MTELQTHLLYIAIIIAASGCILCSERLRVRKYYVSENGLQRCLDIFLHRHSSNSRYVLIPFLLKLCAYIIVLLPLVCRSRLCGADTFQNYKTYVSDDTEGLDFFYYLMIKTLHGIIPDPKIGLGVVSAITLALAFISFSLVKDKVDIVYCHFAYYTCLYFYTYNYMRMMFATSFVLLGYALIMTDRRKHAIILFAMAACFHRSALLILAIGIVLVFFYEDMRPLILGSCVVIVLFLLVPGSFLSLVSVDRYSSQIDSGEGSIGLGTLMRAIPYCILIIFQFNKYHYEKLYGVFALMLLLNIGFSFLGYYAGVASRISNMYMVLHILYYVPWVLRRTKLQGNRLALCAYSIGYCLMIYYLNSLNFRTMGIMPYRW